MGRLSRGARIRSRRPALCRSLKTQTISLRQLRVYHLSGSPRKPHNSSDLWRCCMIHYDHDLRAKILRGIARKKQGIEIASGGCSWNCGCLLYTSDAADDITRVDV